MGHEALNYRHAFHAGNFADVMKHAMLVRILVHLARKEAPFRVVDTHAGIGRYDLSGPEAERTGEWRGGVGRLDAPFAAPVEALLAPYRAILASVRERYGPSTYPGSPAIIREMLRRDDRAILVEAHPDDGALLRGRFNAVANAKVLLLDGWAALGSLIPPRERRGLVLIDPPYEEAGELDAAFERLAKAVRRWPTGLFALWYPIKRAPIPTPDFGRPTLRLELFAARPSDAVLNGSGLLLVNPPWRLAEETSILLPALTERLATGPGAGCRIV